MQTTVTCRFLVLAVTYLFLLATLGARVGSRISPDVFECNRVAPVVRDCYAYLSGNDKKPSEPCCSGAKMIMEMASEPGKKFLGCKCFKEEDSYLSNINQNEMLELSKGCNMNLTPLSCS
ncbi:hypothetical protein HS088_TW04G00839 [Tripterygium wilfordii]|uniref:Bifunctional inhibitor/plant lipid transfer protein/seed storage helical domain-containing protein n=1 Tax=Tripterygium wilfordii TaxID=458696 RepID=A0A7J7DR75_TRIWF|nr:non-specific lipid-transfer protein 3-like [Tripterygium wilfordii]KAF5748878.1 hypothetical protein HS088_TW04G00839 [Tripterygium wilfordii]